MPEKIMPSARHFLVSAGELFGRPLLFYAVAGFDLTSLAGLVLGWAWAFVILHSLAILLQAYAVRLRRGQLESGWLLLGLALSLHLPVVGWMAMLWCRAHHGETTPTALAELKQFTQMVGADTPPPGLVRSEQLRQALEISNHLDAQAGEIVSVRSLVEGGVSERDQIRKLKSFLINPRSDAYHLAQAEIARLLEHFTIQLAEAAEHVRAHPDDLEGQHTLAQWHQRYAESGLLESNLEQHYIDLCLARYRELISREPVSLRWRVPVIDILLKRGRNAEAIEECRSALQLEAESPDIWIRLFEAHFQGARAGSLEPVRQFFQLIRTMRHLSPRNPRLRELIKFWTKPL